MFGAMTGEEDSARQWENRAHKKGESHAETNKRNSC